MCHTSSCNVLYARCQSTQAVSFEAGTLKHCLYYSWACAAAVVCSTHVTCVCVCVCLFFCVSVFSLLWFIVCPNVCLASLFSLAIHCLTAEVFFAAIRFLHCAILCSWRPGMQTVSPPLFHWMLHVLLRCTSLHPLLFISSVALPPCLGFLAARTDQKSFSFFFTWWIS